MLPVRMWRMLRAPTDKHVVELRTFVNSKVKGFGKFPEETAEAAESFLPKCELERD
jgi:hypothetical protein